MINVKFYRRNGEYLFTTPCDSLTVNYELNAVGAFDFQLDAQNFSGHRLDRMVRMRTSALVDGVLQATGYVYSLSADNGKYTVRCNSLMDELTRIRSKTDAAYQDQQLIAILLDLLTYAPEWSLGDITTMIDPLVRTTVDLRGEKRLYNQIIKLLESVPNVYLREGANRTLDIGQFNREIHPRLVDVEGLRVETKYVDIVEQIEPYGGEITFTETYTEVETIKQNKYSEDPDGNPGAEPVEEWVETPVEKTRYIKHSINLEDALAGDPTLAAHAQFPIVEDHGVYVVRNIRDDTVAGMGDFTEVYSQIVPATRENPTDEEVQEAGYALWYKAVRELDARRDNAETWSCRVRSVPPTFKVGDRMYIQSAGKRIYRDSLSGTVVQTALEEVMRWFRIPRFSVTYDDEGTNYDIELAENLNFSTVDPLLALYEAASTEIDPTFSDNALVLSQYSILSGTLSTGTPSDCFNRDDAGYFEGRTLTLPLEIPPDGMTAITVQGEPFSTQLAATVRVVTLPELPSQPAIVCVSVNRDWTLANSATVYLLIRYS